MALKIELEVPEHYNQDQTLYLFAGIEFLGFKRPGEHWYLKDGRCNQCGKCCTKLNRATNTFVSLNAFDGRCIFLRDMGNGKMLCGFGVGRPFGCCIGCNSKDLVPDCTESFKEVK